VYHTRLVQRENATLTWWMSGVQASHRVPIYLLPAASLISRSSVVANDHV
jgi:hypothetical protein